MGSNAQRKLYCKLKQIVEPCSNFKRNRFKNWLARAGQSIVRCLITQDEPRVWQSKDWFGRSCWNLYFPKTEQTVQISSEEEARIWLEENLRF